MTQEQHFDVAAYALGVLDEHDATRFEDHLITCHICAAELENLLPVVDVLTGLDAESVVAAEQSHRDGVMLNKMIGTVRRERVRARSRRLYTLAAAVVLVATLSIGALFGAGRVVSPQPGGGPTTLAGPSDSSQLDPLPLQDGPGIGGVELTGERFGRTDARTGVRADVAFEPKDWGTQISFVISNIKGPLTCRLVAIRTNGQPEILSTWTVSAKGWGTTAQPRPLMLQAVTALPRAQIAHVQLQSIDPNGTTNTLVRVP